MSDAADRRIAELERENATRRFEHADYLARTKRDLANMTREILDLRKALVERDVYEAQQILPPEQAALIKHLATVERCIEEAAIMDYEGLCRFCNEYEIHDRGCPWIELQFDRKPVETMAMVEGWAWEENESWERRRRVTLPRSGPGGHFNVTISPFVPPGKVYVLEGLSSFVTAEETLRVLNERAAPDAPVLEDNANPATVTPDEAPEEEP